MVFRRRLGGRRRKAAFKKRPVRTYRKRRNYAPSSSILGSRRVVKMRYNWNGQLQTGAAGVAGVQVFAANGLYDPDITGVGHQPRGFDQLMTLYAYATVIAAKCSVTFMPADGQANNYIGGILLSETATADGDFSNIMENRNRVYKPITVNSEGRTLTKKFSTKKFMGVSHPMSEYSLRTSAAANPAQMAYFHVFVGNPSFADGGAVEASIVLEYICVFSEPQNPIVS